VAPDVSRASDTAEPLTWGHPICSRPSHRQDGARG
jgi:hypothetical protein